MSKLTKSACYETAKLMAENAIHPKIEALELKQQEIITNAAIKATPVEVINLYDNNDSLKPYFNTESSFRYQFEDLHEDWEYYSVLRDIPRPRNASRYIDLSREDYNLMIDNRRQIKRLKSQCDELQKKIEATLMSLGTYKRIEQKFPEAYAIIPTKYTNPKPVQTIALPIDDLKAELLKYK